MAKGTINWVNPPENKGKIARTDDGSNNEYEYNINAGNTVGGYVPKLNDIVTFTPGPGMTATGVSKELTEPLGCTFEAIPLQGTPGVEVAFSWSTTGAVSAEILPVVGTVAVPSGKMTINVYSTETFTLTAKDSAGKEVSASNTVTIG